MGVQTSPILATTLRLAILVLILAVFGGSLFFGIVDVNGDGLVDLKDAIHVVDQNGDGHIGYYELALFLLARVGAVAVTYYAMSMRLDQVE